MHFLLTVVLLALLAAPAYAADYAADIQPVLAKACYNCHGPKQQMAGLRLDVRSDAARVIQPGKGAESSLYRRVAGLDDQPRMPMGGSLAPGQIAAIKKWIDDGAVWPEATAAPVAEAPKHWAYVPPKRPAGAGGIDIFVRARLAKEGLQPSPAADRVTLLRRASLDVIGLPPTPEEIDEFQNDRRPGAWNRQVDRLLASPHYGERWARVWLDAARYADSDGYEKDKQRQVWFYRDWVINALNLNLPYNQFVIEQIAGDLLPNATLNSSGWRRCSTAWTRSAKGCWASRFNARSATTTSSIR